MILGSMDGQRYMHIYGSFKCSNHSLSFLKGECIANIVVREKQYGIIVLFLTWML